MNKEEYLSISQNDRQKIMDGIKIILSEDERIIFTYIFGSFLGSPSFRDIDVGVYFNKIVKEEVFDEEIRLSEKIAKKCGLSMDDIDVKILNFAPSAFLNNVFRTGEVLFAKNNDLLSRVVENVSLDAVANEYISLLSLKELVPNN
ncbi:TPA: nucleotidyltransferase [Patescibacteria group bacterium]|nr:MAG: Nucleotidyltransferase [Parcubacteria group bacterium GW2011_GWF2_40_10]KKR47798.1 MAG: Nucleotidyltransferase [Parcubacteria group bacterium GW2011_GWA2_40_143]KKR60229.1 MAG: Nucleotidyltransferase [Parcubacteria group bacterium GW2011_GWC2_40_31]KKR75199.1 MAG: Nucleotidyltransferase [Parcubacteria group bacterium GW2011_GWB2_40_8]KKR77325.1 MAG: Nucleotidyltransferase [Parcubacteria group bacterium GW2011_GWE2_40_8]KKR81753.1 MAG: Nucleotidyltransferase [Parcubacteria group bacteri